MKTKHAELIMHPIRFRVMLALEGRRLSTREIAQAVPGVAPATLYRQLQRLLKHGGIEVVEERPAGGTWERVYSLAKGAEQLVVSGTEREKKSSHERYLRLFLSQISASFTRYVRHDQADLAKDKLRYRTEPLFLSDVEHGELLRELDQLVKRAKSRTPSPGRKRRLFSTIDIPDPEVSVNREGEQSK